MAKAQEGNNFGKRFVKSFNKGVDKGIADITTKILVEAAAILIVKKLPTIIEGLKGFFKKTKKVICSWFGKETEEEQIEETTSTTTNEKVLAENVSINGKTCNVVEVVTKEIKLKEL